ncbi:AMP-binding protein [Pseudobdellovibrio exovorus]|uniref:MenE, O-succinylbenzoate-CoA ligase n=1 Tax=Pseudobdellovibrio exovorus JSS TaxID=1184267 RepID=M4V9U4_9BACT|nr:AMP-binding protein [Pseudobdellovibrio exovorus]AGH94801.1 menE, O-succinylbenzoate-CoA ligase [Pseudobdellovibrio exovorus JSS]
MIQFQTEVSNQLLINPRLTEEEKKILLQLQNEFEQQYGSKGFFLVPSSGSSQKKNESVKLIALSRQSIVNSAMRFNQYFQTKSDESWGLVLPEFHVAGLGVYARASLVGASVFVSEWNVQTLKTWVNEKKISYMSMVPTQVYDIVKLNLQCMASIKKVFVGAGALSKELKQQARALEWPIVETYGMTETSSMIAVREQTESFAVLPQVEVRVEETLQIRCNSLLTASIQKIDQEIVVRSYKADDWLVTEDLVTLTVDASSGPMHLNLLGRRGDYVKILGEGVSLPELRERLEHLTQQLGYAVSSAALLAVEDKRRGHELVLVVDKSLQTQMGQLKALYNDSGRPYEKIERVYCLDQLPRTDLGKLKVEEVKSIIISKANEGDYGKHQ